MLALLDGEARRLQLHKLRCRAECRQGGKVSQTIALSTNQCKEGSQEGFRMTTGTESQGSECGSYCGT